MLLTDAQTDTLSLGGDWSLKLCALQLFSRCERGLVEVAVLLRGV